MKKYAIIVAGGSGTRMKSSVPKQFLLIGDRPILMHTIQRFIEFPEKIDVILVLPKDQIIEWQNLCQLYAFTHKITLTEGGATRFQSVKNGLAEIKDKDGLVAIQDGVRPFATEQIIRDTFELAQQKGNAIAAVALKDSIRSVIDGKNKAEDRNCFKLIQTPQTFKLSELRNAYEVNDEAFFTDDASVLERSGKRIYLAEGSYQNIKITTAEDIIYAEAIMKIYNYKA